MAGSPEVFFLTEPLFCGTEQDTGRTRTCLQGDLMWGRGIEGSSPGAMGLWVDIPFSFLKK